MTDTIQPWWSSPPLPSKAKYSNLSGDGDGDDSCAIEISTEEFDLKTYVRNELLKEREGKDIWNHCAKHMTPKQFKQWQLYENDDYVCPFFEDELEEMERFEAMADLRGTTGNVVVRDEQFITDYFAPENLRWEESDEDDVWGLFEDAYDDDECKEHPDL